MVKIFKNTAKFLIVISLFLSFVTKTAFADGSTKNRYRSCSPAAGNLASSESPRPEGLDFDPTGGGKDFMYEIDNPICLAVVLPPYAIVKTSIAGMNGVCGTGSAVPRILPSPVQDLIDIAKAARAASNNPACGGAVAGATASLTGFIAAIGFQYLNAKDVYENTSLCGGGLDDNWTRWNSVSMSRDVPLKKKAVEDLIDGLITNCNNDPNSTDCAKLNSGLTSKDYRQWYYGGVEREDRSSDACPDVTQSYNPSSGDNQVTYKDKHYPAQKYYMRGTEPGNYSCERFNSRLNKSDPLNNNLPLSASRVDDYDHAYKCCIKKSQSTVCIERRLCRSGGYTDLCPETDNIVKVHKFCYGGSRCELEYGSDLRINVGGIVNDIIQTQDVSDSIGDNVTGADGWRSTLKAQYDVAFEDNNRMICVSSYNMCPYNFNIGGGSTGCNYFRDGIGDGGSFQAVSPADIANQDCGGPKSEIRDDNCDLNNKAGKCKNYCQYLNHCVVMAGNDYIYETNISSPYFSKACLNFVGDSKNEYGYNTGVFAGAQKHFTAPIAQCVRETLENVFYNRAGHTKCGIIDESPDQKGKCFTDLYVFKQGENISSSKSFFVSIQDGLKNAIKLVLTVSIMMQGIKILLTGAPLVQKDLMMYVVKIGLVLFFATGNAWQGFFFDGVYNASTTFSSIVMNIRTSPNPDNRDGCQFGKISLPDGSSSIVSEYPEGKAYLSVFDTFDCKIARYLGFGPSATVANIAKMIFAALFTGVIGVYFSVMTMIFGFYMIIAAFRVLHIFLASAFSIILLVYVSPITITASLFKKYEGIFNSWLGNLIGSSLQPIILFAYMGLFITILETLVTGSASFKGSPPERKIVCDKVCVDRDGNKLFIISRDDGLAGMLNDINESIDNTHNSIVNDLINPAANAFGQNDVQNIVAPPPQRECNFDAGETVVDPTSDSIACIMNLGNEKFGKIPVLEPLGVALPMLKNFFSDNGRQKILTLTKGVLVLFILTSFLDEIPGIASNLMGGAAVPGISSKMGGMDMAKKVASFAKGAQKRGINSANKAGGAINKSTSSIARAAGNKGKNSS